MDWVGDPYQLGILTGLLQASENVGGNLLCFVGGQLPGENGGPDVRHRIYELAGTHNVDAMVMLASTLDHLAGTSGLARYCERYRPLPLCSIGVELDDIPSVTADNDSGMRAVVSHLVREHHCRRVALVRGPLANAEAGARFEAYRSVLDANGIPFDERLVVTGTFMVESGAQAVSELSRTCGERLEHLDAIVASNDAMAFGVLSALAEREIEVPSQLAVVGFDDIEDACFTQPPLTTVSQPLQKQGRAAHRALINWLQHGVQPKSERLGVELVTRRSCGCLRAPDESRPPSIPPPNYSFEAGLTMRRQRLVDTLTRVARGSFGAAGQDWQGRLVSALAADLRGEEPPAFIAKVQDALEKVMGRGNGIDVCDELITALRKETVPLLRSPNAPRDKAEELFHLARVATAQAARRMLSREKVNLGRTARTLCAACTQLAGTFDDGDLRAAITANLQRLGIRSCFVAVYDQAEEPRGARMFVAHDERREWVDEGAEFEAKFLLPAAWLQDWEAGRSFAVLPLVWKDRSLGHVLFELSLQHAFAYGPIAEAIGVALRGVQLASAASAKRL
jgi:DNA-binding LacI/PurR family transcriptional regulator